MDNHTSLRLFVSLPLPGAVVDFLEQVQKSLKHKGLRASWPRPGKMHLTLKFIGETPAGHLDPIIQAIQTTAVSHPIFKLRVQGVGVFPSVARARIIWAGVGSDHKILSELYQGLEAGLALAGIPRSKKRFSPHFTLARLKQAVDRRQITAVMDGLQNQVSEPFECRSIDLVQSVLKHSGAVHTLVARADFKSKPGLGRD